MYSVLNTLSEYTYFYISKNITSYTFVLVFKIVESLQCILKGKKWFLSSATIWLANMASFFVFKYFALKKSIIAIIIQTKKHL